MENKLKRQIPAGRRGAAALLSSLKRVDEAERQSQVQTAPKKETAERGTPEDDTDPPQPSEQTKINTFGLNEKRDHRIQIMLTKREFDALKLRLTRRDSLSDVCRNRMIQEGWFDE